MKQPAAKDAPARVRYRRALVSVPRNKVSVQRKDGRWEVRVKGRLPSKDHTYKRKLDAINKMCELRFG